MRNLINNKKTKHIVRDGIKKEYLALTLVIMICLVLSAGGEHPEPVID
jgi:hypothetical protein